jgi:hypothetical protein
MPETTTLKLGLPGTLGLTRADRWVPASTSQAAYSAKLPVISIWWLLLTQHP